MEVENLLPGGVLPHDYQFTPKDLRTLRSADLIFINGLGLENWMQKALKAATEENEQQRVVEITQGIRDLIEDDPANLLQEESASETEGERGTVEQEEFSRPSQWNPHVWLDPLLAIRAVETIKAALQQLDPDHGEDYEANARVYIARLQALHAELKQGLAPLAKRSFATYHHAFPYLVRRYGLNLAGVIEVSPNVEPSPGYLVKLMKQLRHREVRVIFTEPGVRSRLANRLADDLGVPLAELDTLETGPLTPDAYEAGMRKNLKTLKRYLQ